MADEDEIDKLLESFNKLDTVCNYEKCKVLVAVLGVNCNFCRIRWQQKSWKRLSNKAKKKFLKIRLFNHKNQRLGLVVTQL